MCLHASFCQKPPAGTSPAVWYCYVFLGIPSLLLSSSNWVPEKHSPETPCFTGSAASASPSLSKPHPSESWPSGISSPGAAQDHIYRVFKLRFIDLPPDCSSFLPPRSPRSALLRLNLAPYFFIQLNLPYRVSGETHYWEFRNTRQSPALDCTCHMGAMISFIMW